jgi:Fe-S oxidoreductase
MWMEERTGKRIKRGADRRDARHGAEVIATSCPYCLIMLGDAVAQRKGEGQADGGVVIDLVQVLADSVGLRKLV